MVVARLSDARYKRDPGRQASWTAKDWTWEDDALFRVDFWGQRRALFYGCDSDTKRYLFFNCQCVAWLEPFHWLVNATVIRFMLYLIGRFGTSGYTHFLAFLHVSAVRIPGTNKYDLFLI